MLKVADPVCPMCKAPYRRWGSHVRYNPACKDAYDDVVGDCEPDSLQQDAQARERQHALADAIAELTYEKHLKPAEVQTAISLARIAIHQHNARAADGLRHLLAPGVTAEQVAASLDTLEQQQPIFSGLETEAKQRSVLRRTYPYVAPRTVVFGTAQQKADSFSVRELLVRHLTHNPAVLKACWDKSEGWKSGAQHGLEAEVFDDFDSGSAIRRHTEFARKATSDEASDLRVALFFYGDEIEVRAASKVQPLPLPPHAPPTHPTTLGRAAPGWAVPLAEPLPLTKFPPVTVT